MIKPTSSNVDNRLPFSCKHWTLDGLLGHSPRFKAIRRVSALQDPRELAKIISKFDETGEPLIIEGWHKHVKWDRNLFTPAHFCEHGQQRES